MERSPRPLLLRAHIVFPPLGAFPALGEGSVVSHPDPESDVRLFDEALAIWLSDGGFERFLFHSNQLVLYIDFTYAVCNWRGFLNCLRI
jgi:hypothetical protein